MTFGTPDLIIISLILLSALIGVMRGLIKESITLVSWTVATVLALNFSEPLSSYITFVNNPGIRTIIAFIIIAVSSLFLGAIVNVLVGGLVRKTPFSVLDRMLGSLFGLVRGGLFVGILILLGGLVPHMTEEKWWKQSTSISHFQGLSFWLKERLPEEIAQAFYFADEPNAQPTKDSKLEDLKKYKQIKNEIQS